MNRRGAACTRHRNRKATRSGAGTYATHEARTRFRTGAAHKYESIPEMEPEASNNSSEDKVYVPGFGWIESQGANHVEYAEDMYENGNKIGIMG